ncbi:MAG: outer membrane protein assembly factor BamD [bacterium]
MENIRRVVVRFLLVILASVSVSFVGCHRERVNLREMTPDEQFEYAKRIFDKKDYDKAKLQFSIVVMNNPGGLIIEKAQFYLAESYFFLKEYILAVEEYEKLIRSFPQSSFVDDAYYKIGMCYYELSPSSALDQEYTLKAISRFQLFLEDYPDSDLRPEVEKRLMECRTKLAKKEYKSGELYRKMSYYSAAIISFNEVLEKYYDTEYADDALYWKGECHRRLKNWAEAEKAFQELATRYAQSKWVQKTEGKLQEVRRELEKSKNVTEKPDE